jgi:site-specific recombinase XerD
MKGTRALTGKEVEQVKQSFCRNRDKALFTLGEKTGLRISELLSLRVSDVYQYGQIVDVAYVERRHMKKRLEGRVVPLHREVKAALSLWVKELEAQGLAAADRPLFQSRKGNQAITRQQAARILKEVFEANQIGGKVACHSMRKTFAQNIYQKVGRDLVKTQRALGHKCINSTISYLSCQEEDVFQAIMSL